MAGFDAALAHAKAAGKPWLAMTAADFPLNPAARDAVAARLRHHAGPLGHVPAQGLPGRPLERRRLPAGVLGHGPACRRRAHPEPGQPVHERRARRRRAPTRRPTAQPRLQHQGRPRLPHGLVRRGRPAVPAHREDRRREQGRELDRGGRRAGGAAAPTCSRCSSSPSTTSYQGSQDPLQPPYYACPIIGSDPEHFAMRVNRKNIVAAQRDFPEVPRVTPAAVGGARPARDDHGRPALVLPHAARAGRHAAASTTT